METSKLCISEEVPVRQDENYPLRPVVRLVVGDSDTSRPLQTSCQNAYSSCGMGNDSPVSSLSDDVVTMSSDRRFDWPGTAKSNSSLE